MKKNSEREIFQNRATTEKDRDGAMTAQSMAGCDCCSERLAFAMQDKHHKFSLGLSTVLECLKVAEAEGCVPRL